MAIQYVGDCEWGAQPNGESWSVDEFGLDVINKVYRGRSDKLTAFLGRWPKNAAFPGMGKMYKVGHRVNRGGAFSSVVLTFRGTVSGSLPDPVYSYEYPLNTVTLTTDDNADDSNPLGDPPVSVFYQTTAVSVRWVGTTRPNVPSYRGALANSGSLYFHDYDPPKKNLTGRLQYTTDILTTEFTREQVGNLWTMRERHERRVIDLDEERIGNASG